MIELIKKIVDEMFTVYFPSIVWMNHLREVIVFKFFFTTIVGEIILLPSL